MRSALSWDVDQWRTKLHCSSFSVARLARRFSTRRRNASRVLLSVASLVKSATRRCSNGRALNTVLRVGVGRFTYGDRGIPISQTTQTGALATPVSRVAFPCETLERRQQITADHLAVAQFEHQGVAGRVHRHDVRAGRAFLAWPTARAFGAGH